MTERRSIPGDTITHYAELNTYVQAWAAGKVKGLGLLLIGGPPGRGKTSAVREAMTDEAKPHAYLSGKVSPVEFYCKCYESRNQLIVLDDADGILAHRDGLALVKALTDTVDTKRLTWATRTKLPEGTPQEFETTSRVAIISNSWAEGVHFDAVADRGRVLWFTPSKSELLARAKDWADPDVFQAIESRAPFMVRLTLRTFHDAHVDYQIGGKPALDRYVQKQMATGTEGKVLELLLDPNFASNNQRALQFQDMTGRSVKTFYDCAKRLCEVYPDLRIETDPKGRGRPRKSDVVIREEPADHGDLGKSEGVKTEATKPGDPKPAGPDQAEDNPGEDGDTGDGSPPDATPAPKPGPKPKPTTGTAKRNKKDAPRGMTIS